MSGGCFLFHWLKWFSFWTQYSLWSFDKETLSIYFHIFALYEEKPLATGWFPPQNASNTDNLYFLRYRKSQDYVYWKGVYKVIWQNLSSIWDVKTTQSVFRIWTNLFNKRHKHQEFWDTYPKTVLYTVIWSSLSSAKYHIAHIFKSLRSLNYTVLTIQKNSVRKTIP